MDQLFGDNWVYMYYGLIVAITCAQILVVYVLNSSTHPPRGLGAFTVYFIAALLCWVAIFAQHRAGTEFSVDIAAIATMVTSFILFYATGARAGVDRGRISGSTICLAASLSGLFLDMGQVFLIESVTVTLFCAAVAVLSFVRASRERSVGDAMVGVATLLTITGIALACYRFTTGGDLETSRIAVYAIYSATYALILMGFIASVLGEYQHHLRQLATEDSLTLLLNRRGMTEALQVSMAAAARQKLSTSAIMVDIDHFQKINDNFGQEAGDRVIQQIADIISRQARASDVVARVGGEEYLIVLPDTPLDSAKVLAERIRKTLDDNPLLVHRQSIHITVSLGVACVEGQVNLDELSQAADRAMYLAKRGGRNRVASVKHQPVQLTGHGPG